MRRAFLWASGGRYIVMAINLGATLVMARLLAPEQYGVAVLGGAVFAVADALRALSGGAYLIQKAQITQEDIRACFTLSLTVTLIITLIMALSAAPLAQFFDKPALRNYLRVAALGYLLGPFIHPIWALMSRNLSFGPITLIGLLGTLAAALVSITLALQGFGYMSFAWAGAASTAISMLCYLFYCKDRSIFRPIFSHWRDVLKFGVYDSATGLIAQLGDTAPYFIFGRLFPVDVVGLAQRAVSLCLVPERIILAGVGAVALPAFSQQAREGTSLGPTYLRAIELISAAQWPSLCILIFLAQPLVSILLGSQWLAVVPFLQILAAALFLSFPMTLQYASLVATGSIRFMPVILGLQSVISIAILTAAARHGLYAAVWSSWIILPANGILALILAHRFIGFRWTEVLRSLRKSMLCTASSAAGPAAIWFLHRTDVITLPWVVMALVLSALGWIAGLMLTRHPLLDEILRVISRGARRRFGFIAG